MGKNKHRKNKKHRLLFVIGAILIGAGVIHDIKLLYDGAVAIGAGAIVEAFL